jgi:hypothetical protein
MLLLVIQLSALSANDFYTAHPSECFNGVRASMYSGIHATDPNDANDSLPQSL